MPWPKGKPAWSRGLTKDTDERVANNAKARLGSLAWNKGLTKETDERVAKSGKSMSRACLGIPLSEEHRNSISKALKGRPEHPIYVAVENYGLINYGVHLFPTPEEAVKWWKEYTKLEPPKTEHEAEEIGQNKDYGECRIFQVHYEVDETGAKKWVSEDYLWLLIPKTK